VKICLPKLFCSSIFLLILMMSASGEVWLPNDVLYPLERKPAEKPTGSPDFLVQVPQPFKLPAEGSLTVRNFVISTEDLGGVRKVHAVQLVPGGEEGVVRQGWVRFDYTNESREKDEEDKATGFPYHPQLGSLRQPNGLFAAWSPETNVTVAPLDSFWRLHQHGDLVVTLVLEPNGKEQIIQPTLRLWYTKDEFEESGRQLIAETAPDGSVIVPMDSEGSMGPELLTLRMANETIDIPPGKEDTSVRDTFELPVPVKLTAIYPQANRLATRFRVDAFLPNGRTDRIFEINDWQFGQQQFYQFDRPLELPQGTRLEIQVRYRNISPSVGMAARRVQFGPTMNDEMAEAWIQMVATGERHALLLEQRIAEHQLKLEVEAWEGHFNGDPEAHTALAFLYADLGESETAINHGRKAVATATQFKGDPSMAHTALGAALMTQQYFASAQEAFEVALKLDPNNGQAHHNLGQIYLFYGTEEKALDSFATAEMLRPRDYRVLHNLGVTHLKKEEYEMADEYFNTILEINPRHAKATANLGAVKQFQGDKEKALELYRRALMLSPEMLSVLGPQITKLTEEPSEEEPEGESAE